MPFALGLLLALLTIPTSEIFLEAEDAELIGVVVDTTREGYSGSGYVTGFDAPTDSLRFRFRSDNGVHAVRFGVAISGRIKPYTMWIDGREIAGVATGGGAGFTERLFREVHLTAGPHELVLQGAFDIDYLLLTSVTYDPPVAPTTALSDPDAAPATRDLFELLRAQYGHRILSAQQTLDDVRYVEQTTGRSPAIGVFDVIEYSPSRVAIYDARNRAVERWIEWAGLDALVSLSWHWNAPTDLINSETQPWWSGFYTRATTFDVAAALADTTSERYHLLLRDIDAIAVELAKLASADIPVLWRPLHEAAGGWFWWGAKGPQPFKTLWRLLYDRLVHVHGLHNLIWVYTHEPGAFDWYPGREVVDIVSSDVYAPDPASTMQEIWEELKDHFGERHLIALSESGTLPDPEIVTDFGIWWSWFSVWNGPYVRDLDPAYLTRVYESEFVITRDELPDWRGSAVAVSPEPPGTPAGFELYPNPTSGSATLSASIPLAGEARLQVVDVLGRVARQTDLGFHSGGALETSLAPGLAPGSYLVRLVVGDESRQKMLFVIG